MTTLDGAHTWPLLQPANLLVELGWKGLSPRLQFRGYEPFEDGCLRPSRWVTRDVIPNKKELDANNAFQTWWQQATLAGGTTLVNDNQVTKLQRQLEAEGAYRSNDAHIIALARLSGARLLYSNDGNLKKDFGDRDLIAEPRGKVFSTKLTADFSTRRRRLLNQSHCQNRPNR